MKIKKYLFPQTGMTLIEVMVVVGIIAFLSVLVTGYLRSQVFKGNDARRKADMNRIGIAMEEYEKDHDCYPVSNPPDVELHPYLDVLPKDPINGSSYIFEYENTTCPKWYRIYTNLENDNDNDYLANIGPNSSFSYYVDSPNAPAIIIPESTPGPTQGGGIPSVDYYGCFSGVCTQINWDPARPGPECQPSFVNVSCSDQCLDAFGEPQNSCIPWNQ